MISSHTWRIIQDCAKTIRKFSGFYKASCRLLNEVLFELAVLFRVREWPNLCSIDPM